MIPLDTKKCNKCNIEKSLDHYYKSKNDSQGVMYICKSCDGLRNKRYKRSSGGLYKNAVLSAKKRNKYWELTEVAFYNIRKAPCAYCGTIVKSTTGSNIDRIDSNIGYTAENCVSCCSACNSAKNSLSVEQFKKHITRIYNHWVKK